MIKGIFHEGSGLGNQLHRYVATRVIARDKGYSWNMINAANFKGKLFMDLDMGTPENYNIKVEHPSGKVIVLDQHILWEEKKVVENGLDIRSYDPEVNFIEDNTIIDGEFQDERYWAHREKDVREWLKVEPMHLNDDICIIGFRGGEYTVFPDLFLTKEYWDQAIKMMKKINPHMRFEVHTDDPSSARVFFPQYPRLHEIGINWRAIRSAKYSIIANSSFFILPRWLKHGESEALTIAPRFWARRNTGQWAMMQNYYKRFTYI